jgi:hypothetical protein
MRHQLSQLHNIDDRRSTAVSCSAERFIAGIIPALAVVAAMWFSCSALVLLTPLPALYTGSRPGALPDVLQLRLLLNRHADCTK